MILTPHCIYFRAVKARLLLPARISALPRGVEVKLPQEKIAIRSMVYEYGQVYQR